MHIDWMLILAGLMIQWSFGWVKAQHADTIFHTRPYIVAEIVIMRLIHGLLFALGLQLLVWTIRA